MLNNTISAITRLPEFCFVAGTLVHTDNGLKAIEDIRTGDRVLARDEFTGQQGFRPVLALAVTHPNRLYHLVYRARQSHRQEACSDNGSASSSDEAGDDDPGPGELACSGPHPFFVPSLGRFVPASRLEPGHDFRLANGGEAILEAVWTEEAPHGETFTTYNFEVADFHTYFVGPEGVWVHNTGLPDDFCDGIRTATERELRQGKKLWPATERAILDRAKATDGQVADVAKKVTDFQIDEMVAGRVPVDELPTYAQIKGLAQGKISANAQEVVQEFDDFGNEVRSILKLGMGGWEGHHIIPKYIQKRLQVLFGTTWNLDEIPVVLLQRGEHWFPDGLHSYISSAGLHWNQMGNFQGTAGAEAILDALEDAYRTAGRADLANVVNSWRQILP